MPAWLRALGRVLTALLILAWWNVGLAYLLAPGLPGTLIYGIPAEIIGIVLAWKATDENLPFG